MEVKHGKFAEVGYCSCAIWCLMKLVKIAAHVKVQSGMTHFAVLLPTNMQAEFTVKRTLSLVMQLNYPTSANYPPVSFWSKWSLTNEFSVNEPNRKHSSSWPNQLIAIPLCATPSHPPVTLSPLKLALGKLKMCICTLGKLNYCKITVKLEFQANV